MPKLQCTHVEKSRRHTLDPLSPSKVQAVSGRSSRLNPRTANMKFQALCKALRIGLVSTMATAIVGCISPLSTDAERPGIAADVGFCRLVAEGRSFDDRIVRVRAGFGAGPDHIRLFEEGCPASTVFAVSLDGRVDLTLCHSRELAAEFGCPVDGDSGVRAAFTGTYHFVSDGVGRIDVRSMTEVSR